MKVSRLLLTMFSLIALSSSVAWGVTNGCIYRLPFAGSTPNGVNYDIYNDRVWFTERTGLKVGYFQVMTPCAPTRIIEFPIPPGIGEPIDIAVDPFSGGTQVWFTTSRGRVVMLDISSSPELFFVYRIPGDPQLNQLHIDLYNYLVWFTELRTNRIGSIPLGGGGLPVTEYLIFAGGVSGIAGITTDLTTGDVWFTTTTGLIGRLNPGFLFVTLWNTGLRSLETITMDPFYPGVWATTGISVPGADFQVINLDYSVNVENIYKTATPGSRPNGIRVRISDGLVVFAEEGQPNIGLINPAAYGPCMMPRDVFPTEAGVQYVLSDNLQILPASSTPYPVTPAPFNSSESRCDALGTVLEYPVPAAFPSSRLLDLDWSDQPWFTMPGLNAIGYISLP